MKSLFVVFNSLLCLTILLLSSCSKEPRVEPQRDPIMPTELGHRPVYLRIINKSKFSDNDITLHFYTDYSNVDGYSYYDPKSGVEENNDRSPGDEDGWISMSRNEWINLGQAKNNNKEQNSPNFLFRGSDLSVWHQDIIIGIGRDDQEKFQIKGTRAANNPSEINVWLARWWNPGQRVRLTCSRVEVGNNKDRVWSVFVDIEVWDY